MQKQTIISREMLLAKARALDTERRIRAVNQLANYRLMTHGILLNTTTGEGYAPGRAHVRTNGTLYVAGCDCPDFQDRLVPLRKAMTDADCSTACTCKHHYLRLLLMGQPVYIGNSTFRAKRVLK